MSENNDKIRRVDVDKMDEERVELLGVQIGEKVGSILNTASEDINKILKIYGLKAIINYNVKPINTDKE